MHPGIPDITMVLEPEAAVLMSAAGVLLEHAALDALLAAAASVGAANVRSDTAVALCRRVALCP